ncbi:MAG: hypothetical protein L6408_00215 [Nanoarchaeota archaeon]|nr:hypothetical protein [Nanoarchaeota archaeon]
MKSIKKITLVTLLGATLAIGAGISKSHAMESNPDGYSVPDMAGYLKWPKEPMVDDDKEPDGIKETRLQKWSKDHVDGRDIVIKHFKDDIIWAYAIKKAGEPGYVIVDSDCDGDYDEKYGPKEEFFLPDCLK